MKNLNEQDALAREKALDPAHSFIVQAPAGSGKTELLVRRYLVLLAQVRFPESIIAITFTRKAAAEMRLRILNALEMALQPSPLSAKEEIRWQLARKVLNHDKTMDWNLLANPNRLRIQTIDSFCQTLTRQMPLLSTLGDQLTPIDNPDFLYRLAAQELIAHLENESPWQEALVHIFKHLDNDFNRLESLLSELLSHREQWLVYLAKDSIHLQKYLEKSLLAINEECIKALNQLTPPPLHQELIELLHFSQYQLTGKLLEKTNDLNFWKKASHLLLTTNNEWRKQVRQSEGFPSPSDKKNEEKKEYYASMKQRVCNLVEQLKNQSYLHEALIDLKNVPPLYYSEAQWKTLAALFELLPVLIAHLKLVFQQYQKGDYTEILLCALAALGNEENPTDLALSLDYQIQHLLIDEFQDTSITQYQLIEKLIAGWEISDGRTLFLVGDPMQSIYRFRKAEVGLFLQIRQQGINNIPLQALTLSVNFRANESIITWINQCFSKILPTVENINRGAITFSPATAFQPPSTVKAIETIWFDEESTSLAQANKTIEVIQKIKQKNPEESIAVLVRARTHLLDLLPALQAASIPYHAIEIENFVEKSAIQDILALTRALLHSGDRISWLALLRSPFCGLDLRDLYQITQFTDPNYPITTIWQQLIEFEKIVLREETKQRCRRFVPILQQCLQEQHRIPLTVWLKKAWIALGGPTTLNCPEEISLVETYLDYLEKKLLTEGDQFDFFKLEEELSKIVTQNTTKHGYPVEIMTIHKAKGLEYDHVILPSLHRQGSSDDSQLFLYKERLLSKNNQDFLLAPIKASHEKEDLIYNYLLREEKLKAHYELTRLLYVASTRAKKSLTLLGMLRTTAKEGIKVMHSNSLLHQLWPAINTQKLSFLSLTDKGANKKASNTPRLVKRLVSDWKNPYTTLPKIEKTTSNSQFSYQWIPKVAKTLGTAIHRVLHQIGQDGLEYWDKIDIPRATPHFIRFLEQMDIIPSQLDEAVSKLKKALTKILQDPRGRWILSQEHQDIHSEYALTHSHNSHIHNLVIDRTFIDTSGTRWIIDYKTTSYQGKDSASFLNLAMQQHKKQLETYAAAFNDPASLKKNAKIRLGLYFPLTTLWCEWEYLPENAFTTT
ncbi:MAG: UvrD-helicase domain-containing protein [Pseudomonadota bacterium]